MSTERKQTGPRSPSASAAGLELKGRTILVTRSAEQAGDLADLLRRRGARVIEAPVIAFEDPWDWSAADDALGRPSAYDWIIFTSANAVDRTLARMLLLGLDVRALEKAALVAIGPATARGLEERGLKPALLPASSRAEGLLDLMGARTLHGKRVLIPRAEVAREVLPEQLRLMGAVVDVVIVYRTVPVPVARPIRDLLAAHQVDAVTFTSSSTVNNLIAGIGGADLLRGLALAAIGPVTAETVSGHGLIPVIVAPRASVEDLVESISAYFAGRD